MVILFLLRIKLISMLLTNFSINFSWKTCTNCDTLCFFEHRFFQKTFNFQVVFHFCKLVHHHLTILVIYKHVNRRRLQQLVLILTLLSFHLNLDDGWEASIEQRQFIIKIVNLNFIHLLLSFNFNYIVVIKLYDFLFAVERVVVFFLTFGLNKRLNLMLVIQHFQIKYNLAKVGAVKGSCAQRVVQQLIANRLHLYSRTVFLVNSIIQ